MCYKLFTWSSKLQRTVFLEYVYTEENHFARSTLFSYYVFILCFALNGGSLFCYWRNNRRQQCVDKQEVP